MARQRRKEAAHKRAEACKKIGLPPGCCVRWCLLEGPNGGYRLAVGGRSRPQKGDKKPNKGQEFVRIPPQPENDEEVGADVMWSVCVVPGKTSFTNEDDAVQALIKMNQGHEDKGVGKEGNANDKVTEATEDKEKETVPDAEAKGGGDQPDGDGIAESSEGGDTSHGEGVMEPNGDGDGDTRKMDEGESPPKADEEMVCTDEKEGAKEADEPMEEGEQGGEAKPTEDVNDKPAIPSDASVAVAEEGRSDDAPKTNTPNKEGLDATQKLWCSPSPQRLADTLVQNLKHARGWENIVRHGTHYCRLLLGAVKAFPSFCKEIATCARTSKMEPLVRCINEFVRPHLPHLSYTSIALVHGAGRAPMNLHTHGQDDCALPGDLDGGCLFTTGYLGGGKVKVRAWGHWEERLVWGCLVDARAGVLFNRYHLHGPTRWPGERYAIVSYTSASWARLMPAV